MCPQHMTTALLRKSKFNLVVISFRRDAIMDVIKRAYIKLFNKNLTIYGVMSKDLRDYTTTQKDMNKQLSKMPYGNDLIIRTEDLLKVTKIDKVEAKMSEVSLSEVMNYDEVKAIRG